jgi:hypothetical protein
VTWSVDSDGVAVRVPSARVALSTASCYPASCPNAFETAAALGYDGVEVMVWTDPVSQDVDALRRLSDHYAMPVLAIHAPCLLLTQRVWGTDPWVKLQRAQAAAEAVGASTVVVHPPFLWQRDYARGFTEGLRRMSDETDVSFAVENMFPWRAASREVPGVRAALEPAGAGLRRLHPRPVAHGGLGHRRGRDARRHGRPALARAPRGRLRVQQGRAPHPRSGSQPCAPVLERLAHGASPGTVVLEVNTRRATSRSERDADLAEALAFTRLHLAAALEPGDASLQP